MSEPRKNPSGLGFSTRRVRELASGEKMEIDRKKIIIVGGAAAAILGGLLFATLVLLRPKETEPVSPAVPVGEPAEVLAPLVTWEDPAGFSFDYPGNLETDSHEEDEENYVHLELSSADHFGGIIIWMKDTKLKDIEDWEPEEFKMEGNILAAVPLGGHPAKKAVFIDFIDGKITTAALDQEVIVLLEMLPGDNQFWTPIYDQIITSFKFTPLPTKVPQPQTGGTDEIWEEEEVVE